ncbi:sugar ABC transporter ATP-binding protein [Paenibacillus odorifer]|uniref:Sugar ABC transporter ATP-binding protein n=2 Tax=Paenibacillus TaxID=44249 RepID=A0ABX3H6E0_9BACL|nr:sugar ABC transporter ATP-binding protein [Paenibacillus odorifer]
MELRKLIPTAIALIFGVLMILPFIWMLSTSVKTPLEVFDYPIKWIPDKFQWSHHFNVWFGEQNFIQYYSNSLKVAVLSTVGSLFVSSLAAYGFARIEFRGRDSLFLLYLSMMLIPPQILFVPKFIMFNEMGIFNSHWALILPGIFTIFGVFLLRQFFMGIPKEITEAALIDGAGHFRIFIQLIVPLAKPAIATLAILDFSWNWNDYENSLIFLIDKNLYTIPLGLQNFILENSIDYNGMMAAASAAILPMIIIFIIFQKYIIQGVANAAVKG